MPRKEINPNPGIVAFPHVKPWSSVARATSLGQNRAPLAWVEAVGRALLTPAETAVLTVVATRTSFKTWTGFRWRIAQVCRWTGYGRSTVKSAIARLRSLLLLRQDGGVKTMSDDPMNNTYRDVVVYRLAGIPDFELPMEVVQARDPESAAWADQDQNALTCKIDHKTKTNPRVPTNDYQHTDNLVPSSSPRSVEDASLRSVTRVRAERRSHGPIPQLVADRLTDWQHRRLADIARTAMARDGITQARLAARVGQWWATTLANGKIIRSPFAWSVHAIEARPYGCADPRCENGDLWDGDRITGRCPGCVERRRDRAADKRAGNVPTAPWTTPWVPSWVRERNEARAAFTALLGAAPDPDPGIVRSYDSLRPETGIRYAGDQRGGDHQLWRPHVHQNHEGVRRGTVHRRTNRHPELPNLRQGKTPHGVPLPTRTRQARTTCVRRPTHPLPARMQGLPPRVHAPTPSRESPTRRHRISRRGDKAYPDVLS